MTSRRASNADATKGEQRGCGAIATLTVKTLEWSSPDVARLVLSRCFQVSELTIRNPLTCRRCATRLVVECEQPKADDVTVRKLSFACPACRAWNPDVRLSGIAVERVFLDPRGRGRAEG